MYAKGAGVPQDFPTDYVWLNMALAEKYSEKGALARRQLLAKMDPRQIQEAQELSRNKPQEGREVAVVKKSPKELPECGLRKSNDIHVNPVSSIEFQEGIGGKNHCSSGKGSIRIDSLSQIPGKC